MSSSHANIDLKDEKNFKRFFKRFCRNYFSLHQLSNYFPFYSQDDITPILNYLLSINYIDKNGDLFTLRKNKE